VSVSKCIHCHNLFSVIADALSDRLETPKMLEAAARSIVHEFNLKACHFRVVSRDRQTLESVASYGLSEKFLAKGPVYTDSGVQKVLEGKVVWYADCSTDPAIQHPAAFAEEGIVSLLTLPLESRGQVVGVMRLYTDTRREFSADEIELFKVAALFCASGVVDSMFRQILSHVTESIRTTLQLSDVLDGIVKVVCEDLRARGCVITGADPPGSRLEPKAAYGLDPGFVEKVPELLTEEAMAAVLGGECVEILDGSSDPRVRFPQEVARQGIASLLLVPLTTRGKAIGVLNLFTHLPFDFSSDEKQLMLAIGEQCSLAVANAKMFSALKRRYDNLVDDFQMWFGHSHGDPLKGSIP